MRVVDCSHCLNDYQEHGCTGPFIQKDHKEAN